MGRRLQEDFPVLQHPILQEHSPSCAKEQPGERRRQQSECERAEGKPSRTAEWKSGEYPYLRHQASVSCRIGVNEYQVLLARLYSRGIANYITRNLA